MDTDDQTQRATDPITQLRMSDPVDQFKKPRLLMLKLEGSLLVPAVGILKPVRTAEKKGPDFPDD